jgi:hypothetical protein
LGLNTRFETVKIFAVLSYSRTGVWTDLTRLFPSDDDRVQLETVAFDGIVVNSLYNVIPVNSYVFDLEILITVIKEHVTHIPQETEQLVCPTEGDLSACSP